VRSGSGSTMTFELFCHAFEFYNIGIMKSLDHILQQMNKNKDSKFYSMHLNACSCTPTYCMQGAMTWFVEDLCPQLYLLTQESWL
jgi:hypothetical protein